MSTSLLFAKPRQPYYIYAPDYRETSAGVFVLHHLCHALNLLGYEAFITGSNVVNPALRAPLLMVRDKERHDSLGLVPIVIYPETVTGNPMNARVCVRYVLNLIGVLTGKSMGEGIDDLIFYYSEQFLGDKKKEDVDFLLMPTFDTELFKPEPGRKRDKAYLYQNRFPRDDIDFSLFPADVELLSNETPISLQELADKLKSARVLYSYEISNTCAMALACGCPVIYRPEGGLTEIPGKFMWGTSGTAFSYEENGLARATATVEDALGVVDRLEQTFWQQLSIFIEKTQDRARLVAAGNNVASIPAAQPEPPMAPAVSAGTVAAEAPRKKRRLLVCSIEQQRNACPQIRLLNPFSFFPDDWELVWGVVDGRISGKDLLAADVILLHRFMPGICEIDTLKAIMSTGKPVIYETDDLLTHVSEGIPNAEFMRDAKEGIELAIRHASALVVSTPFLADWYRSMNPNIYVLDNYLDFDRFYRPVPLAPGKKLTVGMVGTSLMDYNFALVDEALQSLCKRHAGRIRFCFIGHKPPTGWEKHPAVEFHSVLHGYHDYAEWLLEKQLDIALVPLVDDAFNHSKTPIKWLEYAAAGVATVFSDSPVYRSVVENGRNGLLAGDSPDEWLAAIDSLVANPSWRRQLARTAQAEVRKHFSLRDNAIRYHRTYLQAIGESEQAESILIETGSERVAGVLVLDGVADSSAIESSLYSLAHSALGHLPVIVLTTLSGDVPAWTDSLRYVQTTVDEYPAAVEQLCALNDFDWTVIMEAGTSASSAFLAEVKS
ncbi:MAG TPA: glycosyltransferase [Rhodocyclaceae bacterium]|jgi:glycosyltransferase involved in cell wall biosynthesis|nr:glycosyltransferase [Rhodocyclaceae bacterium]